MCNVHTHARGVAAGAEQRGAMDEAELANAYSSLCALHDSGEISTQERDRQLSLLRASSIVPPPLARLRVPSAASRCPCRPTRSSLHPCARASVRPGPC